MYNWVSCIGLILTVSAPQSTIQSTPLLVDTITNIDNLFQQQQYDNFGLKNYDRNTLEHLLSPKELQVLEMAELLSTEHLETFGLSVSDEEEQEEQEQQYQQHKRIKRGKKSKQKQLTVPTTSPTQSTITPNPNHLSNTPNQDPSQSQSHRVEKQSNPGKNGRANV